MSNDKGIFEPKEGFASGTPSRSPFAVDDSPSNPFASDLGQKSPFSADSGDDVPRLNPESKPTAASPFASGSEKSPFSYDPAPATSPFADASEPAKPEAAASSPFATVEPQKAKESPAPKSDSPFGMASSSPAPASTPAPAPASAPTPASLAPAAATGGDSDSFDSGSIKQLELRAIFGVDRELSEGEILQRSRSLPGIRHLERVPEAEAGALDSVKQVLAKLNFGGGPVRLYAGNAPIDFIREGKAVLAVQTDGSFAPGVRETLMIVARELGKI